MLSRVAQVAEKTKELAGKALEALDVPEEPQQIPSAPPTPSPGLEKTPPVEIITSLLLGLVEALTGVPAVNPEETAEVLITQLQLIRESRGLEGSVVAALSQDSETTHSLIEALETEQDENRTLRLRFANQTQLQVKPGQSEELERLRAEIEAVNERKNELEIELQKTQRMLAKVVKEKADLELRMDEEDKVDARVMRSAFTTLCSQIDNKSVRDGVLMVMAEMLQVSPEDRELFHVPQTNVPKKKSGLGDDFLEFLNSELSDSNS
jgi:hypothetical protein